MQPLAGPVVAACCHIPPGAEDDAATVEWLSEVNDSKTVTEADRERLYEKLVAMDGVVWATHSMTAREIDEHNILQATITLQQKMVSNQTDRFSLVSIHSLHHTYMHTPMATRGPSVLRRSKRERIDRHSPTL